MKKGLTIALAVAAAFLCAGAIATRLDSVWAEALGLFGLFVIVVCLFVVAAARALNEMERGGQPEEW